MRAIAVLLAASSLISSTAYAQQESNSGTEKMALARKYVALTYLGKITRETVVGEIKIAWDQANVCSDDVCRSDFDHAVTAAVNSAYPAYEQAIVKLMADRLTKDEIEAAIQFSETPAGRAIAEMNKGMIIDFAGINHTFSTKVSESVYQSFCSRQAKACARATSDWDAKANQQRANGS